MKSNFLLIVFLIFFCNLTFSQELQLELDLKNKKTEYYINLEQKLNSKLYDTEQIYINDYYTQPLIFLRKEKDIPNLLVYYYFSEKDSIVSEILYEWDVRNFEEGENSPKPLEFQKKIIEKYNNILFLITSKYNQSTSTKGSLEDLSKINSSDGLRKKDTWSLNNLEVEMYIVVSNYYSKKGIITRNPTHRIRLYIKSKKH